MGKFTKSYWVCLWLALLSLIIVVSMLFASCKILHTKKTNSNDTTSVKKTDLSTKDSSTKGGVKTDSSKTKEEFEWWRLILSQHRGDTNVYNFNSYPQPATVIYEGGKGSREEQKHMYDSAWDNKVTVLVAQSIDSMNRKISNLEKNSRTETKGVGLITVILIGAGFLLANRLLGFVGSNYTITKKSKT